MLGVHLSRHLGKWPFPALARGRGCPFLTGNARHQVFPALTRSRCFHFLCSDSTELPCLALPSRDSPGLEEATTGTQSPTPAALGCWGPPRTSSTSWSSAPRKESQCGQGTGCKALALFQHPGCVSFLSILHVVIRNHAVFLQLDEYTQGGSTERNVLTMSRLFFSPLLPGI